MALKGISSMTDLIILIIENKQGAKGLGMEL